MRKQSLYGALLVFALNAGWAGSPSSGEYVGAANCGGCHQAQYRLWQSSHHAQAMQPATPNTVLGNFNDATFDYAGKTSRFYRKNGEFRVVTEGPNGKPTHYRIDYTFGVTPLQQYLIRFPGGRYQALSIAWDTRPEAEGGQRWFHLYPGEGITHDDPLHWTGPYHNWNSRCADCHSTALRENYDASSRSYNTTWQEINVACEACHGPGAEHVTWARAGAKAGADTDASRLSVRYPARPDWVFAGEASTRHARGATASPEIEVCARCHSRRSKLADTRPGAPYLDGHRPAFLTPPLYHADGQIRDEVYVDASFRQSRMFQAGVVCSDCHEPHSGELRASGNDVCTQCHKAAVFDAAEHHHHPPDSAGARCANCHMPEHTYMVVDPRRDHGIRVPDPWLSVEVGTPNACNGCHADKNANWAVAWLKGWGIESPDPTRFTRLLALANGAAADQPLAARLLADQAAAPDIARATALSQLSPMDEAQRNSLAAALAANAPLLRLGAVLAFERAPPALRLDALWPRLDDEVRSVRLEATRLLSAVPQSSLTEAQAATLKQSIDNYLAAQPLDFAESWLNIAQVYNNRGDSAGAEQAYRHALELEPQSVPALVNLADLYRQLQRDGEGKALLERAIEVAPDNAAVRFACGLWLIRDKQYIAALDDLAQAAQLDPAQARYSYVYAVALQSVGRVERAREVVARALARHPEHAGLRQLRVTFGAGSPH